jgi:hypothetical protein
VFTQDVGMKSGSPYFRNIRLLTSPSRSRIRQLRRSNTSDTGLFGLLVIFNRLIQASICWSRTDALGHFTFNQPVRRKLGNAETDEGIVKLVCTFVRSFMVELC